PENAEYYIRLSNIQIQRCRWEDGLHAAESALELDPTNSAGLYLRSTALSQMNRMDEAAATTQSALAANPEDALAHASRGWQEMRVSNFDAAMTHFQEALRLDSTSDLARKGMVETLKARNPIYRTLLVCFLWCSNLQANTFWGLIVGGFLLSMQARMFAESNPQWAPLTWLVLGPYLAFLLTWIAHPLFKLLL
ncbi:MAG: tetratricopeptide repeat protein, partial [Burkholderiales bacterium]